MNRNGSCWRCEATCTQRCARCRVAFYCSKGCQKRDKRRHKPDCDAAILKRECMGCRKEGEDLLNCCSCQRAWYCGPECQKKDWGRHKNECHEIVEKTIQLAGKIKWDLARLAQSIPGMPYTYYWGNIPTVDLLNLSMNEGEAYSDPLALLLCGVGDPRNVLLTIASLPDVYKQQVTFVLNDICPCTLARTVLLLYMLYKGGSEVIDTVIRVWYSLRISESDFLLLMSALEELLAADDLSTLTSEFFTMATPEQLSELKRVWGIWVQLSSRSGRWVTERRKIAFQRDSSLEWGIKEYLNAIPPRHNDSAKLWMENGLFNCSKSKASCLTRENVTLIGSTFQKEGGRSDYDFYIDPHNHPFTGWDYKAVKNAYLCDSLPEMYFTYLSSNVLNKCVDKLQSGQVRLHVIRNDCMTMECFLPVELKYDRITTSNLSDYISLPTLLVKFKGHLNTNNGHSVLVTETLNWGDYLTVINNKFQWNYLELALKAIKLTGNPTFPYTKLVEYYNHIPDFQIFLRAALIETRNESELSALAKKRKLPSIKAITADLGLELHDYVRNGNTVFPFKRALNCRQVSVLRGYEYALEWKLPSST